MVKQENKLFPNQIFQVQFGLLPLGKPWGGSFIDVADAALKHAKQNDFLQNGLYRFASQVGVADIYTVKKYSNANAELKDIDTPLAREDILTALRAYHDDLNGSQLWLMIKAELIGEQVMFDINEMRHRIVSG